MNQELICTLCPMGCHLQVEHDGRKITTVRGNECKRALRYADKEVFHPERTVTTTVAIHGASLPLLPVKTDAPVPRDRCREIVDRARAVVVEAPVAAGDVVLADVLGLGCSLVATRTVERGTAPTGEAAGAARPSDGPR